MHQFEVQGQWRWINRAINEVESGRVPAIIILCRNSTDTEFFQRMHPYPKVFLLASNVNFKDYDNTPNGFGTALVCIAQHDRVQVHERFLRTFQPYGEASMAVDAGMGEAMLLALLSRSVQKVVSNTITKQKRCCSILLQLMERISYKTILSEWLTLLHCRNFQGIQDCWFTHNHFRTYWFTVRITRYKRFSTDVLQVCLYTGLSCTSTLL